MWLTNDSDSYFQALEEAQGTQSAFEAWVKAWVERGLRGFLEPEASFACDLVRAGLEKVNFIEIQEAFADV